MADQFRKSFDEMARQTELDELRKEINSLRDTRIDTPMMTLAFNRAIGHDVRARR